MGARVRAGVAIVAALGAAACGSSPSASSQPSATTHRGEHAATTAAHSHATAGPTGGPVPRGFVASSATFISATEGWVLGNAPCPRKACASLLHTRDGGATWRGVPAPRAPDPGEMMGGSIYRVRFADARNGFAFGPALWVTHDGAAHWRPVRSMVGLRPHFFTVESLEVASDRSVYGLVAPATAEGGTAGETRLVRAEPGGGPFRLVARVRGSQKSMPSLITGGATAFVVVGRRLLVTGRGVVTRRLPSRMPCDLAASSATDLLAICGMGSGGGSAGERRAYGSTDAGAHWTRLPDPGRGAGYDTEGVAATTAGRAVIGTVSGAGSGLLATVDAGRHWRLVMHRHDEAAGFEDIGFENASDGSALYDPLGQGDHARGVLYRTTDGGRTWHARPYR